VIHHPEPHAEGVSVVEATLGVTFPNAVPGILLTEQVIADLMRRSGREFGSETPKTIYVALRWNAPTALRQHEKEMLAYLAKKLKCGPTELRIYNLCRPLKGRGMTLSARESPQVATTIRRIKRKIDQHASVRRIVIGGRSGPMPAVALLLKLLVPRISVELRNHHRARAVDGGPLRLVKRIRLPKYWNIVRVPIAGN